MPVRAVLFDVGDTLWHAPRPPSPAEFRRLAGERAAAALAAFGVARVDPAAVARRAWDALEAAMHTARQGNLAEPHYPAAVQATLAACGLCLTVPQCASLLDAIYLSGGEGGKEAFADARPTLLELRRRGFLLATVTNRAFGGDRFRADLREAGLDVGWHAHAVSVEVGYLKPHPAPFEHALQVLGVAPGEALMVGNSLAEDVAGAQRLGIAAAWRRCSPDAEDVVPDHTFAELGELLLLPGLQEVSR